MRLPRSSPWQFLCGLGLLFLAYLLAVGSGMEMHVEHNQVHRRIVVLSGIMAIGGVFLLWLSLRRPRND